LFSATMGPDVKSLVREFTHDAAIHDVVGEEAPSDVDHYFWRVPREQRSAAFASVLDRTILWAPAFSIRGGTREVLRGIIARALGLR